MTRCVLEMTCSTFILTESSSVLPRQGDTAQFSAHITRTRDLRRPSVCFFFGFLPPEGGSVGVKPSNQTVHLLVRFEHGI